MLSEIAKAWRADGLMHDVIEELAQMIADCDYVFTHAWEACIGQAVISATEGPVRERDKAVNRGERDIRRMLLEHLTINPQGDASGCLAVMAMAKDAERLGDLARDVFKIGALLEGKVRELKYYDRIAAIQSKIAENLPRLERAIRDSDSDLTHEILDAYKSVKPDLKAINREILDDELPTREAVLTSRLVQTLARVNAHLGNTASGIIFPLQNIDFVSRGLRQEAAGE